MTLFPYILFLKLVKPLTQQTLPLLKSWLNDYSQNSVLSYGTWMELIDLEACPWPACADSYD